MARKVSASFAMPKPIEKVEARIVTISQANCALVMVHPFVSRPRDRIDQQCRCFQPLGILGVIPHADDVR